MPQEQALADAFPLAWPAGWPRLKSAYSREQSRYKVSFAIARDHLLKELRLFTGRDVVISTNIPVKLDGLPYASFREPEDPGVAVYWRKRMWIKGERVDRPMVVACDSWKLCRDNLHAIGLTIAGMRAIERAGASQILDRAFMGFQALPASTWRRVLGLNGGATRTDVEETFRKLVHERHPDLPGGSHEAMVELNAARDAALKELRA